MLYLAEVQKKSGGILGGNRAELKLLACQRSEQNWSAVPSEEVIPSDAANEYNAGALVLVDITANRQVQRVQEAGRQLVSILQNFSRLQEKFKTQEEEIEQWKQSLTYQSQELNRREMEMESRREQLQQMEEDFERLEQQRQEVESLQEEFNRRQEEYERENQALQGAWAQLEGAKQQLKEKEEAFQGATGLDAEQAQKIRDLLGQIAAAASASGVHDHLSESVSLLAQQQDLLRQHWERLEQHRTSAQRDQAEVEQQAQDLHQRWQSWHQAQSSLEQAQAELRVQQSVLSTKQDYARMLELQVQNHEELHQQIYRLAETSDGVTLLNQQINVEELERLPIDELQRLVDELEHDLEKLSRFVEIQEEELRLKQQEINELQAKINAANEYDRLNLENELTDEQDGYQMLNETLVGQRRNLQERKGVLNQHRAILRRRQGIVEPEDNTSVQIDLGPILTQVEALRQQQVDELNQLEAQLQQMQTAIQQAEGMVAQQASEQENQRNGLKQVEQSLTERRAGVAEVWGQVKLYEEMLQPIQDKVDALRQKFNDMEHVVAQGQNGNGEQQQAIADMQQLIDSVTAMPEYATS